MQYCPQKIDTFLPQLKSWYIPLFGEKWPYKLVMVYKPLQNTIDSRSSLDDLLLSSGQLTGNIIVQADLGNIFLLDAIHHLYHIILGTIIFYHIFLKMQFCPYFLPIPASKAAIFWPEQDQACASAAQEGGGYGYWCISKPQEGVTVLQHYVKVGEASKDQTISKQKMRTQRNKKFCIILCSYSKSL